MRWVTCTWLLLTTIGIASCSPTSDYASTPDGAASTDSPGNPEDNNIDQATVHDLGEDLPHDAATLPAGLAFFDRWIVESTANPDASTRRLLNPQTGEARAVSALRPEWLGGDLTKVGDRGAQLTVDVERLNAGAADEAATVVLLFDPASMAEIDRRRFEGSALGICHDGGRFYTSDGSANLTRRGTEDLAPTSVFTALSDGAPLPGLSALACDPTGGHFFIYAVLADSDRIIAIAPATGNVERTIDLAAVTETLPANAAALSAIALDAETSTLAVTGPGWGRIITIGL